MVKILVNGAQGRMGQCAVHAIETENDLELVGQTDKGDDIQAAITETQAQVVVDFTEPNCVYTNTQTYIELGVHPVIGTSGLSLEQVNELQTQALQKQLGGIIAPNFSIGAILLMRCAQEAVKYMPNCEIIELHHDHKKDAPSGTARWTAQKIAQVREEQPRLAVACEEILEGARGASQDDIPIHSVRLPGYFAHQEVIFGAQGETFNLRHDSMTRESMMPGVLLACRKVLNLHQLLYGLEALL